MEYLYNSRGGCCSYAKGRPVDALEIRQTLSGAYQFLSATPPLLILRHSGPHFPAETPRAFELKATSRSTERARVEVGRSGAGNL
jgi:hypothetical protein